MNSSFLMQRKDNVYLFKRPGYFEPDISPSRISPLFLFSELKKISRKVCVLKTRIFMVSVAAQGIDLSYLGAIHKPRGQIFGYFYPLPYVVIFTK